MRGMSKWLQKSFKLYKIIQTNLVTNGASPAYTGIILKSLKLFKILLDNL